MTDNYAFIGESNLVRVTSAMLIMLQAWEPWATQWQRTFE